MTAETSPRNGIFRTKPLTEAEVLERFVASLELAQKLFIYIARVNRAPHRQRIMEALEQRMPGFKPLHVRVDIPERNLYRLLQSRLASEEGPFDAVYVYGMENWLPAGEAAEQSPFILNLNMARDHFRKVLNCPLIFWLPDHLLHAVQHAAPDFFSVVSDVFLFSEQENDNREYIYEPFPLGDIALRGLTPQELQVRIDELKTTLDIYQSFSPERRDMLAEARVLNGLGMALQVIGRYTEAEPFYKQALSLRKKFLPDGHYDIASVLNNLAELYQIQGRYPEAEKLYNEAIEIDCMTNKEANPEYSTHLNNLALLYTIQRRYSEAETLYNEVIKSYQEEVGEVPPAIAASLQNLAGMYQFQGQYKKAETLYKDAIAIQKKILPDGHPDIAHSLNNLALLYGRQGRYTEAESLFREALTITENGLGAQHPYTRIIEQNYNSIRK